MVAAAPHMCSQRRPLLALLSPSLLSVLALQRTPSKPPVGPLDDGPIARWGPRQLAFRLLQRVDRGELVQPRVAIFMSGLPGAGKSTFIDRRYRPKKVLSTRVLDLDSELVQHPRFDPSDPDKLYTQRGAKRAYAWANRRIERQFHAALADRSVRRLVLDGTGTNSERQVRRMRAAREAGFFVKVLHVDIPLETAVRRAAHRARPVSAAKIYLYQTKIGNALAKMAEHCDEFETFDAPARDPAHVLAQEGFVDKSRAFVAAEAEAKKRAEMAHARALHAAERAHKRRAGDADGE